MIIILASIYNPINLQHLTSTASAQNITSTARHYFTAQSLPNPHPPPASPRSSAWSRAAVTRIGNGKRTRSDC